MVIGYEALMRPLDGSSPVDVIEQHRRKGTIAALDQTLMRQAMEDCQGFLRAGELLMVNTEPETLSEAVWDPWEYALKPNQVVIEITERACLDELDLNKFLNIGVQFALDDFGTGMSNLLALERLKPAFVKMNREFLAGHDDSGVLALLAEQFVRFGSKLIVEGVESESDLAFLRHIRVRYVQGFYTGRPAPAQDYIAKGNHRYASGWA